MRAPLTLIDDLPQLPDVRPNNPEAARWPLPGWGWLGCIVFGIAVWTAVGFGVHVLINVL